MAAGVFAVALVLLPVARVVRGDAADYVVTAALVIMPLAIRRVVPTLAALAIAAGIIATAGRLEAIDLAAFAVVSFSMADVIASRRRSLLSLVAIAGAIGLWFAVNGSLYAIALGYLVTIPAWVAGDWWRDRRERAASRADAELAAREDRIRQAVLDERRRLARELHDVVAHDVGVIVVQAGGARQILDGSPDRARAALEAIESTGRDALTELRRLLGVLADDRGPVADLEPHPTLADIDAMVARLRAAGIPVELRVEGEPAEVRSDLGAAAYRIVQEGLTNAMKHAPGAATTVLVRYGPDAISVEVADEGAPTPPAAALDEGRGLAGMRERAEMAGGSLEAGPRRGGGYLVAARWPVASGQPSR